MLMENSPADKLLNGVTNNITDHAVSGLSYLHPHLSQVCRKAGIEEISLDLIKASPLPTGFTEYQPLVLSSRALHQKFVEILEKNKFSLSDVSSAVLTFKFLPNSSDDYSGFSCACELITTKAKRFHHKRA